MTKNKKKRMQGGKTSPLISEIKARFDDLLEEIKEETDVEVFGATVLILGNKDDPAIPLVISGATDFDAIRTADLFRGALGGFVKSLGFARVGSSVKGNQGIFRKGAPEVPPSEKEAKPEPPKNFPCTPIEDLESKAIDETGGMLAGAPHKKDKE